MKHNLQFALAALVGAVLMLVPSTSYAATRGAQHTHAHQLHDHTPHVHDHGAHSHHG